MTSHEKEGFVYTLDLLKAEIAQNNVDKGFTVPGADVNWSQKIALMHDELSEAHDALRAGDPPSDHIHQFSGTEEEFADVIIRILDYASLAGLRIGEAILTKHAFNKTRPFMHGGKKF